MSELMIDLKKKLDVIVNFIEDKDNVIFLDYPIYHNIGDILIFLGTIEFFKQNRINIKKFYSVYNFQINRMEEVVNKKTTIIFQGGGNFGDLYPKHQSIREEVVKKFKDNKIIILPQTSYFISDKAEKKSIEIFQDNPNVILCARDLRTYETFTKFSNNVVLTPDMAHYLYGKLIKSNKEKSNLYFLRRDVEKSYIDEKILIKSIDWDDLVGKKEEIVKNLIIYMLKINKVLKNEYLDIIVFKLWLMHSDRIVKKSSKFFSKYKKVITSRLHGHILSCLLDIPSSIIDNSYGKNSAYHNQWTRYLENTQLLEEIDHD